MVTLSWLVSLSQLCQMRLDTTAKKMLIFFGVLQMRAIWLLELILIQIVKK